MDKCRIFSDRVDQWQTEPIIFMLQICCNLFNCHLKRRDFSIDCQVDQIFGRIKNIIKMRQVKKSQMFYLFISRAESYSFSL